MSVMTISFSINEHTKHLYEEVKALQDRFVAVQMSPNSGFPFDSTPKKTKAVSSDNAAVEQLNESLKAEILKRETLEEQLKTAHEEIAEKKQALADLWEKFEGLQSQQSETEGRLQKANEEHANLKEQADQVSGELRTVQSEHENLQKQHQDLSHELSTCQAKGEALSRENQSLENALSKSKKEKKELASKCAVLEEKVWPQHILELEQWLLEAQQEDVRSFLRFEAGPCNENRMRLLVMCGRYNNIEQLWKKLQRRCSDRSAHGTTQELSFASFVLECFNYSESSTATQMTPAQGDVFLSDKHYDMSDNHGQKISTCFFPGLVSISNKVSAKAMVGTERY